MNKLDLDFFRRDVLQVAPEIPGKNLVIKNVPYLITEVEAYRGEEDLACHASKGRTPRTEIMYHEGGHLYIYLIYGVYWMLNIVTGKKDEPQAVLIRGIKGFDGPGKLTRHLQIDRSYYGENVCNSGRIWLEESSKIYSVRQSSRIGIEYAGNLWMEKPWRFFLMP
jgi:DNA-3-methyladenine glycosylase